MRTDYYVYILFRKDGRPFYVGKGSGDRWLQHERGRSGGNNSHLRAVLKQENYNYPKIKIREGLIESEALAIEMAFIAAIGRRCDNSGELVNLTLGGEGVWGLMWSADSRRKASESNKNRVRTPEQKAVTRAKHQALWTPEKKEAFRIAMIERWTDAGYRARVKREKYNLSEEHKAAISAALSTPENRARMSAWATGRVKSAATKEKLSVASKGKKLTEEHKAKIGDAHRGRPGWLKKGDKLSDAHRAAISAARKGGLNGWEGKKLSAEHKAKVGAARRATIERKKAAGIPDLSGRGRRAKYERMLAEQKE